MKNKLLSVFLLLFPLPLSLMCQGLYSDQLVKKTVVFSDDTVKLKFVHNKALFSEGWDALPQVMFWQNVISLSPDSCIINLAAGRKPLDVVTNEEWKCQDEGEKENYRQCLKNTFGLSNNVSIYVTTGKKDFYEYKKVIPLINAACDIFISNGVDPWYAQTILLIESPGKIAQKSSVGAFGPFQIMPYVAKKYGLKITKYNDERSDLNKSAHAASRLLGTSFIPKVKEMLNARNISYNETDLWFRLLVMHAYHAGPGNVSCVLSRLNPREGGVSLFKQIWQTECRGFKNESQNYSQIALASIVLFNRIISQESDSVFMVEGDRMFAKYNKIPKTNTDGLPYLNNCIRAYESDLLEGMISFEYFIKKAKKIQKEIIALDKKTTSQINVALAYRFPLGTAQLYDLGNKLMRKRKVEDAIKVFKFDIEQNPYSHFSYDSLGRAYRMQGKNDLAMKYSNKSAQLKSAGFKE